MSDRSVGNGWREVVRVTDLRDPRREISRSITSTTYVLYEVEGNSSGRASKKTSDDDESG